MNGKLKAASFHTVAVTQFLTNRMRSYSYRKHGYKYWLTKTIKTQEVDSMITMKSSITTILVFKT